MDKVEITNSRIEKTLEWSASNTLDNSGADEAAIIGADKASPHTRSDENTYPDEEEVAFPPDTTGRDEEDGTGAAAQQKVSSQ